VTTAGWFLIRAIAMVFDRHLRVAREPGRFSRLV
jgi:oxygen-independent coproporphyrinogen-3 oxidase